MTIDVNNYIHAPSIQWMNRLVVLSQYTTSGNSEILIADYTLTYQKVVVKGGLNIFPKWADSKQESIYYTKYLEVPTIVRHNLATGQVEQLVGSEGVAMVSDVSKNGENLILSLSPTALSDLYLYNTKSKNLRRLTNYSGIDVDGKFVNDEKEIIFVSDRLGYPNIFMMRIDGGGTEQVVLHAGYAVAMILMIFCPDLFTGIAFDSGGVASGPLTSTFVLSFTIGAANGSGGSNDSFGVIALVALMPLIAIQIMGIIFKNKTKKENAG